MYVAKDVIYYRIGANEYFVAGGRRTTKRREVEVDFTKRAIRL